MANFFLPDFMLSEISEITPAFLKEHNIKALILDVDNTLTVHGSQALSEKTAAWLLQMRDAGIPMCIVSNNTTARVEPFAKMVGLPFVSSGLKPVPYGIRKAQSTFGLPSEQIAVVGDQVFTDVIGGNLQGMRTILVTPVSSEENSFVRWKRKLEKPILSKYQQRNEES